MTDEEMAEKYVAALLDKYDAELDKLLDEKLEDLQLNEKQAGTILGIIKEVGICSFFEGLRAGRPKWHDLMEDPKDIPEKRQHILCYTSDPWCHNQKGLKNVKHCDVEMGTYMGNGEWYMGCYHTFAPPKAWCEIPKYEGKK